MSCETFNRERTQRASNQVSNNMTFKERDVGREINCDRWPRISEWEAEKGRCSGPRQ